MSWLAVPENIKSPTQARPWTVLVSFGTCPHIKWFSFNYNLYDNMLETLIQPSLQKCRGNTCLILLFKLAVSILTIPNSYMLLPSSLTTARAHFPLAAFATSAIVINLT